MSHPRKAQQLEVCLIEGISVFVHRSFSQIAEKSILDNITTCGSVHVIENGTNGVMSTAMSFLKVLFCCLLDT